MGLCLITVIIVVLTSYTTAMGYQTVELSPQQSIKGAMNQRELVFQTIVDIANNKEIQRIILKSQMSQGIVPVSDIPILTKYHLKQMYTIGLSLSKALRKTSMQVMPEKYQFSTQEIQKEIPTVVEKDSILKAEITQGFNSECDCENKSITRLWNFPIICAIFGVMFFFVITMPSPFPVPILFHVINFIGRIFGCSWSW